MDDDDSCVIKYIEIVPRDNFEDCSDVTDVKCEPLNVKVCVVSSLLHLFGMNPHLCSNFIMILLLMHGVNTDVLQCAVYV